MSLRQRIKKEIPKDLLKQYIKDNGIEDFKEYLLYASDYELQDILDCTIGG